MKRFWASYWPERIASLLAFAGIFVALLPGFHVRLWDFSGSDFKTLYASAWCLARGVDPYQVPHIASVFAANQVVPPPSWYGHGAVYPPFTLALLTPLTLLPMVPAVYLWAELSVLALACGVAVLAQVAGEVFHVHRALRLVLILLAVLSPLVGFALWVSNVSMVVFALCVFAIVPGRDSTSWLRAVGLAAAFLLKPHTAVWVMLAMLLMREPKGQRLAWRATAIAALAAVLVIGWMAVRPAGMEQLHSYVAGVHSEMSGGSMDVASRDVMRPAAQITSLASLMGYWSKNVPLLAPVAQAILVLGGLLLAVFTRRVKGSLVEQRYPLFAAWGAFGLIATYHRAQDGILLFVLLPWLIARLQRAWADGVAWGLLLLGFLMSFEFPVEVFDWLGKRPGLAEFTQLVVVRQAALATFVAVVVLWVLAWRAGRRGGEIHG